MPKDKKSNCNRKSQYISKAIRLLIAGESSVLPGCDDRLTTAAKDDSRTR